MLETVLIAIVVEAAGRRPNVSVCVIPKDKGILLLNIHQILDVKIHYLCHLEGSKALSTVVKPRLEFAELCGV